MSNNIFRQQALDRLASPERLSQMIHITSSKSWLALVGMFIVFVAVFAWGFFGKIPKIVQGKGILIKSGGVTEVASLSFGKIEQIIYNEGDEVMEGDIIAIISQPDLEMQLQNTAFKLEDLKERYNSLVSFDKEDYKKREELLIKKQKIQEQTIISNQSRLKFVEGQITSQDQLLEEGLITKETLNNTKQLYFQIQQDIEIAKNELKAINLELFEFLNKNEISLRELRSEILDVERLITELRAKFLLNSSIKSPYDGIVVELLVNPGRVVNPGDNVVTLEVASVFKELEAVVYMPPSEGKRVEEGMKVKIAPSTVEVEEYGYMTGIVRHVSDYPASVEGMERLLGNSELAKSLSGDEPPIAIFIDLNKDSTSFSGYEWTSVKGPKTQIKSGTLCAGRVIIETQKPITLLFPKIKDQLDF